MAPSPRAFESPIAIACFGFRALCLPSFMWRISLCTSSCALGPYLLPELPPPPLLPELRREVDLVAPPRREVPPLRLRVAVLRERVLAPREPDEREPVAREALDAPRVEVPRVEAPREDVPREDALRVELREPARDAVPREVPRDALRDEVPEDPREDAREEVREDPLEDALLRAVERLVLARPLLAVLRDEPVFVPLPLFRDVVPFAGIFTYSPWSCCNDGCRRLLWTTARTHIVPHVIVQNRVRCLRLRANEVHSARARTGKNTCHTPALVAEARRAGRHATAVAFGTFPR